jgi:sRNA-binding carbon storage regulator CsrA
MKRKRLFISRAIKVKVIKETANKVTIRLKSANRKMHVNRKDFEKRVKDGLYEIINKNEFQMSEA